MKHDTETLAKKLLTENKIRFTIEHELENTAVKGNCSAIDAIQDKETEDFIYAELERGNYWAWCTVKISAYYQGIEVSQYLGCCSYESEDDFKRGGYYDDMCSELAHEIATFLIIAKNELKL